MHVAIDRENMGFMWAHPSYEVLLDLAHIEADCEVHVVSLENPRYFKPFSAFTDLELKLLYENTTGEKYVGFNRDALCEVVCGLAMRLPQVAVNVVELRAQAACVEEGDVGLYKYLPGAREPKLVQDGLFGVAPKRIARCTSEEKLATQGKLLPTLPDPLPLCAGAGRDQQHTSTSTPARTRAPGTAPPPRGSTRETIWACADRMWEAAGKPTTPAAVLALRKQMMNQLEADGVKRTSSSNELGNWQKTRIV
jgi:hypothetical protein